MSKDSHSPGPVIKRVSLPSPYKRSIREVNLVTESSAHKGICQGQIYNLGEENLTSKYQFQSMGFEMPGNDDSWYTCLGEQGPLWVYCVNPLNFCKAL